MIILDNIRKEVLFNPAFEFEESKKPPYCFETDNKELIEKELLKLNLKIIETEWIIGMKVYINPYSDIIPTDYTYEKDYFEFVPDYFMKSWDERYLDRNLRMFISNKDASKLANDMPEFILMLKERAIILEQDDSVNGWYAYLEYIEPEHEYFLSGLYNAKFQNINN